LTSVFVEGISDKSKVETKEPEMSKRQEQYAATANVEGLLIAELNGVGMGIGTRDELQSYIDKGWLPEGTTLREAIASDF
jgi:hypothetical protein